MPQLQAHLSRVAYAEVLEEAWAEHLAPRAEGAPTVLSTFAGCGGSSLGYSMAGYREVLAVEWEEHAAEVFRLNFPHVPVYQGDVCALSVEEAARLAGVELGKLDVLDGSPPCQGFSTSGKRSLEDPRNALFLEFARLLEGLKPRAFVMENVAGMAKGKMRLTFAAALRRLKQCGYRTACRLLSAEYFGVPQHRPRVIFVGVREDLDREPVFPRPRGRPVSAREALAGVGDDPPEIRTKQLSGQARTIWGRIGGRAMFSRYHPKGHWFNAKKVDPDRPVLTLGKVVMPTGPAGLFHWAEPRVLTIAEAKRVSSFPDAFRLTGTFVQQWGRLGNSVPPLFMRAIAADLRAGVLEVTSSA